MALTGKNYRFLVSLHRKQMFFIKMVFEVKLDIFQPLKNCVHRCKV
jgi:hypothetical protein